MTGNCCRNVIFITDDTKEDWWYILESRGKKQIGPQANLQSEIYREARIDLFFMYNTSKFLEDGKRILKAGVHDSSISDANIKFVQSFDNLNEFLNNEIVEKEVKNVPLSELVKYIQKHNTQKQLLHEYLDINHHDLENEKKRQHDQDNLAKLLFFHDLSKSDNSFRKYLKNIINIDEDDTNNEE